MDADPEREMGRQVKNKKAEGRERALDRVRKLLELSKSNNEHEAAQAAARAADLMLQHKIEEAELDTETEPEEAEEAVIGRDGRRVTWKLVLVGGIAKSMGGSAYYSTFGRLMAEATYRVVAPSGAMPTIRYLYQYLVTEVNRLAEARWEEHRRVVVEDYGLSRGSLQSARAWKSSFRVGCARAIRDRLQEQREKSLGKARKAQQSAALAVIDRERALVDAYLEANVGPLGAGRPSSAGSSAPSGYSAGVQAGKEVSLSTERSRGLGQGQARLKGGSR